MSKTHRASSKLPSFFFRHHVVSDIKIALLKIIDKLIGYYLQLAFPSSSPTPPPQIPFHPQKIAIIKLSAMGDVLCLMPAIRQLKKWHPQVEITLITTKRSNPQLFHHTPFLDFIDQLPISPLVLIRFIWQFKRCHYDLCIDADQYYHLSTWLALQCRYSVGFHTSAKPKKLNLSLTYDIWDNEKTQFLKLISLSVGRKPPQSFDLTLTEILSADQQHKAHRQLSPYTHSSQRKKIVIYPGSSDNADFRRWPIEHYKQIIIELCRSDYAIYIAGGPDELAIKHEFHAITSQYPHCHNLIGELELSDWLYFLHHHIALFVGNDAGLLHIAEAAGVPIVGLFGPNIYSKWGSLNPQSIGIEIPIKSLNCRPCIINSMGQIPKQCWRGDHACLQRISPHKVLLAIENFFVESEDAQK